MFEKKNAKKIEELRSFLKDAPAKTAACKDLGQYMATVRAPLNMRLIDLALGIELHSNGTKQHVKIESLLKDDEVLQVTKMVEQFVAATEIPFMESLNTGDNGIPLVFGIEMPKTIKKSKKGVIEMVFRGTESSAPLAQQCLTASAVHELAVFGKQLHKIIWRNRFLIGAGVTIALVGLAVGTYFLVIKPRMDAKRDDADCDCCDYGGMDDLAPDVPSPDMDPAVAVVI